MASEYFKKLAKEQAVIEPVRQPQTPKEKWDNWWDYNKNYVLIGLAAVIAVGLMIRNTIVNRAPEPDYQLAVIGSKYLPEETVLALEDALTVYGHDLNGDGKTVVNVVEYPLFSDDVIYQTTVSAQVRLSVDFEECESVIFLMEDPERVQTQLQILAFPDGSIPAEEEVTSSDIWYAWGDCPVLADLDLGEELEGLYVARRYMNAEDLADHAGVIAFWETLTKDAK